MSQTVQHSARLRADVDVYPIADGHVLRVAGVPHRVELTPADADALLDALVSGTVPAPGRARAALDSLVDAGLVDPAPAHHTLVGDGLLARALSAALERMGATVGPGGSTVVALDSPQTLRRTGAPAGPVCWLDGHLALLAPSAVPAQDVDARHRAATRHRDTDPATAPARGARIVTAPPSPAGLELAAAVVAAELLRAERPAYEAVLVDLRALTVRRAPVLPVPPVPR